MRGGILTTKTKITAQKEDTRQTRSIVTNPSDCPIKQAIPLFVSNSAKLEEYCLGTLNIEESDVSFVSNVAIRISILPHHPEFLVFPSNAFAPFQRIEIEMDQPNSIFHETV